jgi:hypothetical protein
MIPNFGRLRQLPAAIFGELSFSQLVLFRAELIGGDPADVSLALGVLY